jgi:hypothetical protein
MKNEVHYMTIHAIKDDDMRRYNIADQCKETHRIALEIKVQHRISR